jgi:redox-sensitive bicupin YhaK (pirin superfamily)
MITVRPARERGHGQHGWLDTRHTFSFNDYHDPRHMGFRVLRVINEDRVQAGQGFPMHAHQDMEIVSYVLEGALAHRDSLGNGSVLHPGELQCMTAGTGIRHSEFNPSADEPVHFYQIWMFPERRGLPPRYDQRAFPAQERRGRLRVVASPGGRDGALAIHQNAEVFLGSLSDGDTLVHELGPSRHAWLQVMRGSVGVNSATLTAGDGAAISEEPVLTMLANQPSEIMLFDLP